MVFNHPYARTALVTAACFGAAALYIGAPVITAALLGAVQAVAFQVIRENAIGRSMHRSSISRVAIDLTDKLSQIHVLAYTGILVANVVRPLQIIAAVSVLGYATYDYVQRYQAANGYSR